MRSLRIRSVANGMAPVKRGRLEEDLARRPPPRRPLSHQRRLSREGGRGGASELTHDAQHGHLDVCMVLQWFKVREQVGKPAAGSQVDGGRSGGAVFLVAAELREGRDWCARDQRLRHWGWRLQEERKKKKQKK